ncbi:hypothetical protein [Acetobacter aceti]|uniref:Uncharacterized protein n=1 Tax=Acetobacter aceti TaxID=435 RepID=A0A6S6PIM4_ACEAC|nr:hypothetical protein [Acetobacter aceti]BCI66535.1 hypothetical protein AAJCM20276_11590 [Acetobacter aceti]
MTKNKINSVSESLVKILKNYREDYPEACALTDAYIQTLPDMNRNILSSNLKTPELITSGILVAGMGTLFYTTAPSIFFPPFYSIAKNISEFVLISWLFTASVIVFFAVEITKIFITSDTLKQLNINNDLTSFLNLWEEIESNKEIPEEATRKIQTKITLLNFENACKYQKHIQIVFWFARFCTIIQGLTIAVAAFSAGWIEQAHKQYPHCFSDVTPGDVGKAEKCQSEIRLWKQPLQKPQQ